MNGGIIMTNFDAVLFDFDGTVADTGEGVFFCVRHAIDVHSLEQPSDEEIRKFIGPPMTVSFHTLYPWLTDDDVDSLMKSFRQKYDEIGMYKYYIYDGIAELLQKLKAKKIPLGICSDLTLHIQIRKLQKLGLVGIFDKITVSEEVGADKPAAIMFTSIAQKLGADPKDCVMIGDNYKRDILGAKSVGMQTILYGKKHEGTVSAQNFTELAQML